MPRLRRCLAVVLLIFAVGTTSGCASITARAGMFGPPADLYPGVGHLMSEARVRGSILPIDSWFASMGTLIDIPLTLAFDTVMLPLDLLYAGIILLGGDGEGREDPGPDPPGFRRKRDPTPLEIGR